jgi:hypothetical protein
LKVLNAQHPAHGAVNDDYEATEKELKGYTVWFVRALQMALRKQLRKN